MDEQHIYILLPSELLRIVISCKIVKISMKLKFFNKIAVIHQKFLVLFNLLRGPDITSSDPGRRLCISILYRRTLTNNYI